MLIFLTHVLNFKSYKQQYKNKININKDILCTDNGDGCITF